MTRLLAVAALAASLLLGAAPVALAEAPPLAIHLFGSSECGLCQEAAAYLRSVAAREGAAVYWHPAKDSARESALMRAVAEELNVAVDGYPFIVVGRRSHVGWKGSTTGLIVTNELAQVREAGEEDVVATVEAALDEKLAARAANGPPRFRLGVGLVSFGTIALLVIAAVVGTAVIHRKQGAA